MKPIGFVYLTTNLVNGKVYVGQRHFLKNKKANAEYLGSGGIHFQNAIKKYGRENFKRKILRLCFTSEELNYWEKYYSIKYNPNLDPKIGYNKFHGSVSDGDNPSFNKEVCERKSKVLKEYYKTHTHHAKGTKISDEHKYAISEHNRKREITDEMRENISNALKRFYQTERGAEVRKHFSEIKKGKPLLKSRGRKMSEEQRAAISKRMTGRKISEEQRLNQSIRFSGENNPNYGHKWTDEMKKAASDRNKGVSLSEETKRKIGEALKGKKLSEEHKRKISESNSGRVISKENRIKMSECAKKRFSDKTKHPMYGKTQSESAREKMRLAWVKRKEKMKIKNNCNE